MGVNLLKQFRACRKDAIICDEIVRILNETIKTLQTRGSQE